MVCLAVMAYRQGGDFLLAGGAALLAMGACGLWIRLLAIRRHGFQVIEHTTRIVFTAHDTTTAQVTVYESCLYQALLNGQNVLHTRKYVHQPTSISGEGLLSGWNYRVDYDPEYGDVHDNHFITPQVHLHEARALNLAFRLPRTLREGERIRLNEGFEFKSSLSKSQNSLLFPVFLPTRCRRIILVSEDLYPEEIHVKLLDGMGVPRSISVPFIETETGARQGSIDWPNLRPGQEAEISWRWSHSTVETAQRQMSQGTPDVSAELADGILAERLMKSTLAGDAATDAATALAADPPADDEQSAEDHPLIKAARARLGIPRQEK